MKKKLFIKTWGCQMNVYDSQRMEDVLAPLGYVAGDTPDDADMIILNTCHIREKATEKVFSELGRMKEFKTKDSLMAVAGCVAQAEGDLIMKRAPYVDMVFGPQTYHELPEMVAKAIGAYGDKRGVYSDFAVEEKFDNLPVEQGKRGPSAFVSVQEGCDKFCTFCVVPYTRGAEFSRKVEDIIEECKRLSDQGVREVNLLGQNVNAYHGVDKSGTTWGLARLIEAIAEIDGMERIRYTTSHPRDMDDDLIRAHGDVTELMPFLHLPIQSGSNTILKAMNRKHERDLYYDIIERLRAARPDIAMSSDFIVGFPGESEQDFEDTMQVVRDIEYIYAYSFKYSARPGTPAANMPGLLTEAVKDERLQRLQGLLNEQQYNYNLKCVGTTMPVLLERQGQKDKNQLMGRTPYNQSIHIEGNPRLIGQIMDIDIIHAAPNSLKGILPHHEKISA